MFFWKSVVDGLINDLCINVAVVFIFPISLFGVHHLAPLAGRFSTHSFHFHLKSEKHYSTAINQSKNQSKTWITFFLSVNKYSCGILRIFHEPSTDDESTCFVWTNMLDLYLRWLPKKMMFLRHDGSFTKKINFCF